MGQRDEDQQADKPQGADLRSGLRVLVRDVSVLAVRMMWACLAARILQDPELTNESARTVTCGCQARSALQTRHSTSFLTMLVNVSGCFVRHQCAFAV